MTRPSDPSIGFSSLPQSRARREDGRLFHAKQRRRGGSEDLCIDSRASFGDCRSAQRPPQRDRHQLRVVPSRGPRSDLRVRGQPAPGPGVQRRCEMASLPSPDDRSPCRCGERTSRTFVRSLRPDHAPLNPLGMEDRLHGVPPTLGRRSPDDMSSTSQYGPERRPRGPALECWSRVRSTRCGPCRFPRSPRRCARDRPRRRTPR
jgi:hypothetical protein